MRHQQMWIDETDEPLFRPPSAAMVLIRLREEADRRREREASARDSSSSAESTRHEPNRRQ